MPLTRTASSGTIRDPNKYSLETASHHKQGGKLLVCVALATLVSGVLITVLLFSESSRKSIELSRGRGAASSSLSCNGSYYEAHPSDGAPHPAPRSASASDSANNTEVAWKWLTIFSCPKGLKNPSAVGNEELALRSWLSLDPPVEVILVAESKDNGVCEMAAKYGVMCELLTSNDFSPGRTPLLSSVFDLAEDIAPQYSLMMYINSDIVLPADTHKVVTAAMRLVSDPLKALLTGQRTDCSTGLSYSNPLVLKENAKAVRSLLDDNITDANAIEDRFGDCVPHGKGGKDYFVFISGLWARLGAPGMLPFSLGRPAFDDWMLRMAHHRGIAVDASPVLGALHLMHDYKHVVDIQGPGNSRSVYKGVDRRHNIRLMRLSFRDLGIPVRDRSDLWGSLAELPHFRVCPTGSGCREYEIAPNSRHMFARAGTRGSTKNSMGARRYSRLFGCVSRCRRTPPVISKAPFSSTS